MIDDVVVVGAGGFAREALDVIEAINSDAPRFRVLGFVDDDPAPLALERMAARGYSHLGPVDSLARFDHCMYVIAIGAPDARSRIAAAIGTRLQPATLIHPAARLGSMSTAGLGSVICSGAQISTNVTLGRHVHINPNATVGHDAVVSDYVSVNPGAIVSGEVLLAERVLVGAGAVILQGLTVGERSVIGAAACVVRDVSANAVAKGVPAR